MDKMGNKLYRNFLTEKPINSLSFYVWSWLGGSMLALLLLSWQFQWNNCAPQPKRRNKIAVSRGPYSGLAAYRKRMGLNFKWVSWNTEFNFDHHVSFSAEELANKEASTTSLHKICIVQSVKEAAYFTKIVQVACFTHIQLRRVGSICWTSHITILTYYLRAEMMLVMNSLNSGCAAMLNTTNDAILICTCC